MGIGCKLKSLHLLCISLLLVLISTNENQKKAEKIAEEEFLQYVGNTTPVTWIAVKKLGATGRDQFCQNICGQLGREVTTFDDARVESGILRFVHQTRNELIIEVLMCRTLPQNESSSVERAVASALPTFSVARGKQPKCVTYLKQFVPTMKVFAVIKQVCNVTMPPRSERAL